MGGSLLRRELNTLPFCLRTAGTGSEDGVRLPLLLSAPEGVEVDPRWFPVILRANLRKGDIERDRVFAELGALDILDALGGVTR